MSTDVDREDLGVLGPGEVGERLTTPRALTLIGRQWVILDDRRQVRIIPAFRSRLAALLAAGPPRRGVDTGRVGTRRCRRRGGLGLGPQELLLAEPQQGLQPLDLLLEPGLTVESPPVHGFPVGGLPERLELLLQPRADRTRPLR